MIYGNVSIRYGGITGGFQGRRKRCDNLRSRRQVCAPVHLPQDAIGLHAT